MPQRPVRLQAPILALEKAAAIGQTRFALVLALVSDEYHAGKGLALATSMYAAARCVGEQVRKIDAVDREALERDSIPFNCQFLLGGQVRGEEHELYLIYPQGNPLRATRECPFLQVGETKYGRPILDRGVRYGETTLEEAAKYALISLDSCMRSNLTVGPPIDLAVYRAGDLRFRWQRRFEERDPQLIAIRSQWEQALRQAVQKLPAVDFDKMKPSELDLASRERQRPECGEPPAAAN
jgi:putative proteasome-type protease